MRKSEKQKPNLSLIQTLTTSTPEYSQGIQGDGAVVLRDGCPMTVEQIVDVLNGAEPPKIKPREFHSKLEYWLKERQARLARDRRLNARKKAEVARQWRVKNAKPRSKPGAKKGRPSRSLDTRPDDRQADSSVGVSSLDPSTAGDYETA